MADYYGLEFVGGPDGTIQPPKKLDHRLVGGKERGIRATKPQTILNIGDRLYVGKLVQGAVMRGFGGNFDTSLGAATLSLGTTANPTKYVNGKTITTTDINVSIGPKASAFVQQPLAADEELWITVGGAAIPAAVIGGFEMTYKIAT